MKKVFVALLMVGLSLFWFGTCFAATANFANLTGDLSGVSFGQTPVISGTGSGDTLYVVSGGFALEDMTVRAITGVTVWEVRPNLVAGNIVLNQAYGFGQGMRGFQPYTGATVSPSSPVLIDNGSTGNSIFFVTNIADAGIGGPGGVSGFVLVGLSAQANGAEVENVFFETGVTSLAVLGPLAWTDQGWKAGSTSGTSLFFGTADVESGGTNVGLGLQAGASVYSVNTNAQFTARSTDAANNVNARYEAGVSGDRKSVV